MVTLVATVVTLLLPPMMANALYFRRAKALIAQARVISGERSAQLAFLRAKGGTSGTVLAVAGTLCVVPLGGILAAIATPAYVDYVARTKVSEALVAVAPLRDQIADSYLRTHRLPERDYEAVRRAPGARYIKKVAMDSDNGVVTITFDIPELAGKQLLLVPRSDGRQIEWRCRNRDARPSLLPSACRN